MRGNSLRKICMDSRLDPADPVPEDQNLRAIPGVGLNSKNNRQVHQEEAKIKGGSLPLCGKDCFFLDTR